MSALSDKYIPPHKRNNKSGTRNSEISYRKLQSDHTVSKNRRRDLSQGSNFNTKSISSTPAVQKVYDITEPKMRELGSIEISEIPEIIVPTTVQSISCENERTLASNASISIMNDVNNGPDTVIVSAPRVGTKGNIGSLSISSSESCISTERHKNKLFEHEIKFLKEISALRAKQMNENAIKEYNEWIEHYNEDLDRMYITYIDPSLEISYDEFIKLAYECSEIEFDRKKLKYTRPLI